MEKQTNGSSFILALSIVLAATIFGYFFYVSRPSENTIRTTGFATKSLEADIIKWRLTLVRTVGTSEFKSGYARLKDDLQAILHMLTSNGVADSDITVQPVSPQPVYSNLGVITSYQLQQPVFVVSSNTSAVEKMALDPSAVTERGVLIQYANIEYFSSQLPELKRELLAAATEDARRRADEIAGISGMTVRRLNSARAGVFQITEPYSADVSSMGMYNTATKRKDISVTVSAEYVVK